MPDDTGKNEACPGDLSCPPNQGACAKELTDASASCQEEYKEILKIGLTDPPREYVLCFLALLFEMRYRETNLVLDLYRTTFYNQESLAVTQQGSASAEYMANLGSFIGQGFGSRKLSQTRMRP